MSNVTNIRSLKVLEGTPARVLTFLKGVNFHPIRASMQRAGYSSHDHDEGWKLMMRACGSTNNNAGQSDEVTAAVGQIDAWDESGYRRVRAALTRLHPEQCEFVFAGGLVAGAGMEAVVGLTMFLDRS